MSVRRSDVSPYQTNSGAQRYKAGTGISINGSTISGDTVKPGPVVGLSNVSSNGITVSTYTDSDGNVVKNISETLPITSTSSTGIVTVSGGVLSIPDASVSGSVYKNGNVLQGTLIGIGAYGSYFDIAEGLRIWYETDAYGQKKRNLCVAPGRGMYIDGYGKLSYQYSIRTGWVSTSPSAGNFISASTYNSSTGVWTPTYMSLRDYNGPISMQQDYIGFKVDTSGWYRVNISFVHGGTSPQVYVGYYDGTNYNNRFIAGYTAACSGSGAFFIGCIIYLIYCLSFG